MNIILFSFLNLLTFTVASNCECEEKAWTDWSDQCSATCGDSYKTRTRICSSCNGYTLCITCNQEDAKKPNALRTEYKRCSKDPCRKSFCIYQSKNQSILAATLSSWGDWSTCSKSCGENGQQKRSRDCLNAQNVIVDPSRCSKGTENYRTCHIDCRKY